ncbi:hypothetical protein AG1IA_04630 [Rhizoctonia solani AG-1 IA]|uniref:Uncharacterized protein n=1 Tax=Thanatephorus cucumeris (strain AG1-IA) TaxID=983506 RepID=L8WTQ1_THACA|nr:hypothetical protein AG1IA_04630 [Rhizoctonia solani AG-1 IA]
MMSSHTIGTSGSVVAKGVVCFIDQVAYGFDSIHDIPNTKHDSEAIGTNRKILGISADQNVSITGPFALRGYICFLHWLKIQSEPITIAKRPLCPRI